MIKIFRVLALFSAITVSTAVQAASLGDISIYMDWSTMNITGATMTPTSITIPGEGTFSSDGEGWVGNQGGDLNTAYAIDGASAIATYTNGVLDLSGGYSAGNDSSGGTATVNNAGPGLQEGYAGGWHGMFYEATSTGQVTISVDYSINASVSTDSLYEYSTVGYEVFMDAADADLWLSTYSSVINGGGSIIDAELAAESAATLDDFYFNQWNILSCSGVACSDATGLSGTISVTFDAVTGKSYAFGADASAGIYTDVSAVPVPAAVWLLGSGLIGLVGVARRKKA